MAATRKPSSPVAPKPSPEPALDTEAVQALRRSSCPTLSGKSTLHYELGLDAKQPPLIRITACTGGGFFSKEWVSLLSIRFALQKSKAVTAILLFPLVKGKSVNTPGYLLAWALNGRHLTLTCRLSSDHSIIGNWPRVSRLCRRIC